MTVKIALLGAGTVGSQVARLITEQREDYQARIGAEIELIGIVVSDTTKPRPDFIDSSLLTTDAETLIDAADVVVELIGGIEPARTWIMRALTAGKTVVTGNKALLAAHGPELHDATAAHNANLYFEAAVAGAVPVVYGLRESMSGDRVERILGIVNGTTNFILDEMSTEGMEYDEALTLAQQLGYAEADPTADVEGLDAGAKCAILASLGFHTRVSADDVDTAGITGITVADIAEAKRSGTVIKLLAIAERVNPDGTSGAEHPTSTTTPADGEPISVRVHPTIVSADSPLATVSGAFNAIILDCDAAGRIMFYGQGAGGIQTASAVMSDVVAAATHTAHGGNAPRESAYATSRIIDPAEVRSAYKIRLHVRPDLGTLAEITALFAANQVSIAAVDQQGSDDAIVLTISTEPARSGNVEKLTAALTDTAAVREVLSVLHML
ncbi:MAG: homoserine dehydrogenase [Varibaculum sp.]|nr:homoserine dehydrogenase [Varibaculum sp.]